MVLNEVEMSSNSVGLKGDALTMSDVEEMEESLGRRFLGVRIIETRTSPDKRTVFTLSLSSGKKDEGEIPTENKTSQ